MHGRTPAAFALIALALLLPAMARADTMPPGDYTVQITQGTVKFGQLSPVAIPGLPPLQVTLADQPVTIALPLPYSFDIYLLGSLTISTTLDAGQATIDPATGAITADLTLHTVLTAVPGPFLNVSGTCTFGSQEQPIAMHLSTTPDSVWKLPGRSFTLYDNSYAIPAPVCDDATLESLVVNAAGDTSAGHNAATFIGTAARPGDEPPPTTTAGETLAGGGSSTSGSAGPSTGASPESSAPVAGSERAAARCVVPRLKGRTLAAAKRALRRAGCRLGKVAKRKAHRRPGTVIAQSRAPGKTLPRGSRVRLVVARR